MINFLESSLFIERRRDTPLGGLVPASIGYRLVGRVVLSYQVKWYSRSPNWRVES